MYSLNGAESCNSTFNNQHSTLLIRLLVCKYVITHYQVVYCGEVPPLPIPNREVKITCADGTAMQCGRVGSRLLLSRASITKVVGAFLFSCGFYFLTQIAFFMQIVFCHADFADDADSIAGLFVFYSIISFSQKVNLDFLYYMRGLYIMNNPEQCCSGLLFHLLGLLVILLFSRYFAFRKQL